MALVVRTSERRPLIASALLLATLPFVASPVSAQEPPGGFGQGAGRPYRGLFGSARGGGNQLLTLNLGLGGGFADQRLVVSPGTDPTAVVPSRRGGFGNAFGGLVLRLGNVKYGFVGRATGILSYYPNWTSAVVTRHTYNVSAWINPFARTKLQPDISVSYRPVNDLQSLSRWRPSTGAQSLSPTDLLADTSPQPLIDPGSGGTKNHYLASRAHLSINHALTARTNLYGLIGADRYDYPGRSAGFATYRASAGVSRSLSKTFSVRVGYGQQFGRYSADGVNQFGVVGRTIDAGIDFRKPLSISRSTTLWVSTGSTALSDGYRTRYQIVGHAGLSRTIGRTWSADVAYRRDVTFVGVVLAPVLLDGVSAGFGGLIGRRVSISNWYGAMRGTLGVTATLNDVTVYTGASSVTMGLTRGLGLTCLYSHYNHAFDNPSSTVPGVLQGVRRNSFSVNLNISAPLLSGMRRSNATR